MMGLVSKILPKGSKRPIRFILLGHPRSGSNLVSRSLETHSQVAMLSEVLSQWENVRTRCWRGTKHSAVYEDGMDGAQYLDERVFLQRAPWGIRACGFKLFYDQARFTPAVKTAWDYIRQDRDIRIIHLKRENLLDSRVSLDVALRTNQWLVESKDANTRKTVEPFAADIRDYQHFFDNILSAQQWVAQAFTGHPVLELEYARDLCAAFPASIARVYSFLGVDPGSGEQRLAQQRSASPAEILTNYAELRDHFRHTAYEGFFDHPGAPK